MTTVDGMPSADQLLPGRSDSMELDYQHAVLPVDMREVPEGSERIWLGLGCFWGAERLFWQTPGVVNTAVGYAGGQTPNPTYKEVCTGCTGHAEIVQLVFDPRKISLNELLRVFWQAHDPTQGMRQGNDIGTQYRSAIYCSEQQLPVVQASTQQYQEALSAQGFGSITSEIRLAPEFYYAEQTHQQYLHKNPAGYCGLKGTGVVCPI
ncbi:MAG: peptide-methionine (S)-S-oxide reductase MsrA [Reinekea sp.]|jgi:peptide-methionine (S)-S-oxide reductase